ncbi:helix-turn-helix domain-containing protein [Nocardioides aequoreus]|uniref:helix-turn-helix domain-containing protein n=1 Tax=Nocardioides aequoreus TaxID=397278 RepID=UPI0004C4168B|nr:helix-turn-helix domain-containing protein [Nocardioides aequoreus]
MGSWTNASAPPTATTAGVLRPEELARYVALRRWPVSPALEPWVENLWGLRWALPPDLVHVSSVLPHPACNVTVERGVDRAGLGEGAVVTGVVTRRFDTEVRGSGWVLGAKLRPGGLRALVGVRADTLRDRTVAAADVLPGDVVAELERLGPDGDDDAQAERLDAALAALAGEPDPEHQVVLDVVATMLRDRSLLRVDQVEQACGLGRRRLQRLFAEYVGVGPKWVLARYRMHDVVTALDEGYAGSLADLAAAHGWFDQAHFTRDFTRLVGESPTRYRDRRR